MNKQFTRNDKLKILQRVREGKVSPNVFSPPKIYVFTEKNTKPGFYEYNGKEYNETEYRKFCDKINRSNKGSIIWNEGRQYPTEDSVLKVCKADKIPQGDQKEDQFV
ncbi:MAG TPA: hypothetical protein PLB49_03595 [Chitinophagaceae bacterium]|nr:hypothetical protein [Chitinophagaceae bacterium]HPH30903.1 hypothetical protein [Chitinophagaceae bacterium]